MRRRTVSTRIAAVAAAAGCAALVAATQAAATTEPTATFFDHIALKDNRIVVAHAKVDVGSLVVFIVRNDSKQRRNIVVGSYKSGFLAPGKSTQFELSFPVPWSFRIVSKARPHPGTLTTKFVCTF